MSDWRKGAHIEGVIAEHKMMGAVLEQCQKDNGRLRKRITELEWLVAYVISGLNDWSDGRISNSVFFTEAAAKRVRALVEKDNGS